MRQGTLSVKRRFANFWWGDQGMLVFLLLLFAALFLAPFFESVLLRSLSAIFFSLLLISGVAYISPRPLWRRVTGTIATMAIALRWLEEFRPTPGLAIAASLLTLLCLVALLLVVLIRVFRDTGPVTTSRVQGAVVAYVLFGVIWSVLYQLIDLGTPAAFSISAASGMTPAEQRESFTYFSFVTLTTVGYGDITAIHPIARMFVVFEALVGQLYPATLLARLVSLEISHRPAKNPGALPAAPPGNEIVPEPQKASSRAVTTGKP